MTEPSMIGEELVAQLARSPELRVRFAAILADAGPARTLYTVATLALELDVSDRTIRRAIEEGELRASRRVGRYVMTVDDVRAWALSGCAASPRGPRRASDRPDAIKHNRGGLAAVFALQDAEAA